MDFQFHAGDLVAFWGRGFESWTIRAATLGPSHVGMIFPYSRNGYRKGLALFESTTLCIHPCLEFQEIRPGVQAQDPWERLIDYDCKAVVYRLTPFWSFTDQDVRDLSNLILNCFVIARDGYDMARALISGTKVLSALVKNLLPVGGHSWFCSELCAAIYQRANKLNHRNPYLYNPARLCRELVNQGKATAIPVRDDFVPTTHGFCADLCANGAPWMR